MPSTELTQGSIIYGIRSDKYPGVCSYGVIISARCDIANCKIQKFHFLIALRISDWVKTAAYKMALTKKVNEIQGQFKNWALKNELNYDVLKSFSAEEIRANVNEIEKTGSSRKSLLKLCEEIEKYQKPIENCHAVSQSERFKELGPQIIKILEDVSTGNLYHYCYIPQIAYIESGRIDDGIIVDLQEIEQVSTEEAILIQECKLDYMDLTLSEIEEYNKKYCLECSQDIVVPEYVISSPWIEYLMQRFSHCFIRIGVDNAIRGDFDKLLTSITEG